MKEYNLNDTHLLQLDSQKTRLRYTRKTYMSFTGTMRLSKVLICNLKEQNNRLNGPSGCGKSTYLRSLNRMNDGIANSRVTGKIMYKDVDVNTKEVDVYEMRKRIGMVFSGPIHLVNLSMKISHSH